MSFVGKAVSSVVKAIGSIFSPPQPQAPMLLPPAQVAPAQSQADTSAAMDKAAQTQAAAVSNGKTSTMLTGGAGETEDQKYSSKILLGQ